MARVLLLLLAVVVFIVYADNEASRPTALEPRCITTYIHHPNPARLVRVVDSCNPSDTVVLYDKR